MFLKSILILFICLVCTIASADEYYLGQWEWTEDEYKNGSWQAPYKEYHTGSIDMRSLPQCGRAGGTAEGYAVFSYSEKINDPDFIYIGSGKTTKIANSIKAKLKEKLNYTGSVSAQTPKDLIYELFTEKGDPTGQLRWKPLLPTINMKLEIHMHKEKLKEVALVPFVSKEWELVLKTKQEDYRRMLETEPYSLIARVLDSWEDKYGVSYETFIPDGVIKIASLPHHTSIAEDWDGCGNSDSLNCDLTWTEYKGDIDIDTQMARGQSSNAYAYARADTDLDGDDHTVTTTNALGFPAARRFGSVGRKDSSATITHYHAHAYSNASGPWATEKVVADSHTGLGSDSAVIGETDDELTLVIDGSTLKRYKFAVLQDTTTDSSITGNVRTGIICYNTVSPLDDFSAEDLAAAASEDPMTIYDGTIYDGFIY